MDKPPIIYKEACIQTYAECIIADERAADRLELCSELECGGISP